MNSRKWFGISLVFTLILHGCIEPYDPPLDDTDVNLLVVDGFLHATDGIATVALSRTVPVDSDLEMPRETRAKVFIQDRLETTYPLPEIQDGLYQGPIPNANIQERYRLIILTGGREYASDLVKIVETPPIDSVTWAINDGGLEFYVTTHDPTNASRYYRWKYSETYEYRIDFNSLLRFEGESIVDRPSSQSIFTCWKTNESTGITIGSTKQLKESVVNKFPVMFVPPGTIKTRIRYSLLVQQQALSEEAYEYWRSLEKSTENLGGLFDALPTEVSGNIRSLNHPAETVIGYFGAGIVRSARIFVRRGQLPEAFAGRFPGNPGCVLDTIPLSEVDRIHKPSTLLIHAIDVPGAGVIGYGTAPSYCADCRTLGGTTIKPNFWD